MKQAYHNSHVVTQASEEVDAAAEAIMAGTRLTTVYHQEVGKEAVVLATHLGLSEMDLRHIGARALITGLSDDN